MKVPSGYFDSASCYHMASELCQKPPDLPLHRFLVVSPLWSLSGIIGPSHPQNSDHTHQWGRFSGSSNPKSFESLLDETVEGPVLAFEMKKAEMETSDLIMVTE